jgi:hypothetical protein
MSNQARILALWGMKYDFLAIFRPEQTFFSKTER